MPFRKYRYWFLHEVLCGSCCAWTNKSVISLCSVSLLLKFWNSTFGGKSSLSIIEPAGWSGLVVAVFWGVSHCRGHRCFSASALWACFFIFLFIRTCSAWPILLAVTKFYFQMFWWDWNTSSPHFMTCLEWNIGNPRFLYNPSVFVSIVSTDLNKTRINYESHNSMQAVLGRML